MSLMQLPSPQPSRPTSPVSSAPFLSAKLDDVVKHHVLMIYRQTGANKVQTADLLGVSRSTLYRMLTDWGLL